MNRKNIYTGIVLAALIVVGGVYTVMARKSVDVPLQIEWRSASTLPTSYSVSQNYTWYSLQNNAIYCMNNPVPNADTTTFVASSLDGYGKDKNHVYWCNQVVENLDPATFTVLDGIFGKDAAYVVYGGYYLLSGADAATFNVVPQSGYAKDKDHVYNTWRELPGADPATFEIVPPNSAKDKNAIYISDKVFGPASLITDNAQYATALPAECNTAGADPISPQLYPGAFSADGNAIGYSGASRTCVIDKKAGTVQVYPYGTEQSASLSGDGSKILYFKYQKGDGVDGETCADCGQYSFDRATEEVMKIP